MTATQPKSNPAELNDELHALIDLELGHPRRRTSSREQAGADSHAVHAIAGALRKPDWDSELLEEICDIIRDTGRPVGAPPLVMLAS